MRESITGQEGETREVNAGEEIICRQKEYNDGYDGYYEDLLPVDHGRERFETDSAPVKKIIILAAGVLVVIGLCVLMLYFV